MLVDIKQKWLLEDLPEEVITSSDWLKVLRFFVIESPCSGQSNRRKDICEKWGNAPWAPSRYLKIPLNLAVFGTRSAQFVKVGSKSKIEDALSEEDLLHSFPSKMESQRAVFTKANGKGNSSSYMSLFYHIRNALAHARFGLLKDKEGQFVFVFEDGRKREVQDKEQFELTARGIVRFGSLLKIIEVIESGPDAKPDIEEQILAAIKSGLDTKKQIMRELNIPAEDWRTYSQVLRKEGKISCDKHKWSLVK